MVFRLRTLERLRGQEVDVCARRLYAATGELEEARRVLESLRDQVRGSMPGGTTTAEELLVGQNYRERLRETIRAGDAHVERLETALEQARQSWIGARARLKAVNALHERYQQGRRAALARAEQSEVDELAGNRAIAAAAREAVHD
jgi:flagellar export protein FliJ